MPSIKGFRRDFHWDDFLGRPARARGGKPACLLASRQTSSNWVGPSENVARSAFAFSRRISGFVRNAAASFLIARDFVQPSLSAGKLLRIEGEAALREPRRAPAEEDILGVLFCEVRMGEQCELNNPPRTTTASLGSEFSQSMSAGVVFCPSVAFWSAAWGGLNARLN